MSLALVCGGANSVWADIDEALALSEFDGIVGCNDFGAHWTGPLDAWVSLHPNKFKFWNQRRIRMGLASRQDSLFGTTGAPTGVTVTEHTFQGQQHAGSSGLFAAKVALIDLKFSKVVLCGIPMDAENAHFFDDKAWKAARHHRAGWAQIPAPIKTRMRSMGGWTKELLGAPTQEWLTSD